MTKQDRVFAKCAWRLVPFMTLLYVVNYVDRVNVGFAALTRAFRLPFTVFVPAFSFSVMRFAKFPPP